MAYVEQDDLKSKITQLHREGEERGAQRLAEKLGLSYADLGKTPISLEAVKLLPENEARDAKVAVVEIHAKKIAIAAVNPELPATKKMIAAMQTKGFDVKVVVVSSISLAAAWKFYQFVKPETEDITGKVRITKDRLSELRTRLTSFSAIRDEFSALDFSKTSPLIIMEIMLAGALAVRASDIHIEAEVKKAKMRLRVDGLLHDIFNDLPLPTYDALIARIKLLSGMKINVGGEAQDGRFAIGLGEQQIEMRVSVIPAEFGETIVMRILDPAATMVTLAELGLREDNLVIVKKQISRPNGLILNTGPTGSGKTTTLYAFLRTINNSEIKIITLEDPIEYQLPGIEQTQVNEDTEYTFANGLRAIVRQDPDVILVGEVRDLETADIALQAALTGHLVLSTLHTNDAIGAVPRLVNLGVKVVSIGPALALVIAQRLVRVLCPHCKKPATVSDALKANIKKLLDRLPAKVDKTKYENYAMYDPGGCDQCNTIGYKGRIGVFEFLEGGADLEEVILKEASEISLREVAKRQEMVTMQEDGILKVLLGQTTISEVEEATGQIAW